MADKHTGEIRRWLADTKFHPPTLRADIIPRPSLLEQLLEDLSDHPLILLSAPAGYGKTTLLASLHATTAPNHSLAWLTLDEEDNDPARFLTAIINALKVLDPRFGATSQSLLSSVPGLGVEIQRLMSVLINDIVERFSQPFSLILDDLHLIYEPAIFVGLNYLLDHIPPHMHLLIASRRDPALALARLRARGQVAELRLAHLRFSSEEARIFLNERRELHLSDAEIDEFHSRTDGWAVGLRLLAGSLDRFPTVEERGMFLQNLAQHDRYIFDFLAEEVFHRQEKPIQEFLLETSVLPELTARLCQAVTERSDAGDILDELYRRNLLLVETIGQPGQGDLLLSDSIQSELLSTQPSYHYHDLFAAFLLHKLEQERPESLPQLHLRAARAQGDGSRAVVHYLAAGSWTEAAGIIEAIGADMFARGYIDTLGRWINTLPEPVRESHPRLLHYLSNCAFWKGEWSQVGPLLEHALQGFEAAGDEEGQGEVLTNLATLAMFQEDYSRSIELFDMALTYSLPPHIYIQSRLGRASLKIEWGDWDVAEQDFKAAMAMIRNSGDLDLLNLVTFPFFDPGFAFLPGGIKHLEWICHQARTMVGLAVTPLRLVIEEMTSLLFLFRGQFDQAIRTAENAVKIKERLGGHPFTSIEADLILITAHTVRGDYDAVDDLLDSLMDGLELASNPMVDITDLLFAVGRIYWLHGRIPDARAIYELMLTVQDPEMDPPTARFCRTWMWSLLEMSEGRYVDVERALCEPEIFEQNDKRSTINGNTRLMLARLFILLNRQQDALEMLGPVLDYYQELGLPFPILVEGQSIVPLLRLAAGEGVRRTYALQLLEMLGANESEPSGYIAKTGKRLTSRETEVLQLVASGYSNQEIAEQLVISVWTVKSHLTQIYRKLDVTSRTQAIASVREWNLV